ncbi:MAG: hypothetical protein DRJ56_06495 [Thermoprotei archaeon]|nr:MAG: hypothetical protein DRJ56_06495 [Thermoprotei archaeon]
MRSRGQARVIEMTLATAVITAALVVAMSLTTPLRPLYLRETSDLRRLAYNLLNDLADARVFEDIVVKGNLTGGNWEDELKLFIAANLPPELVFRVDVYQLRLGEDGSSEWVRLNRRPVSKPEDWATVRLVEAEAVTYSYVVVGAPEEGRGCLLRIDLVLGYGG